MAEDFTIPDDVRDLRPLLESLIAAVHRLEPKRGAYTKVSSSASGTVVDLVDSVARRGGQRSHPFQVTKITGAAAVRVKFGTVQNVIPDIGGSPMTSTTQIPVTGDGLIVLHIDWDGEDVTAADITFQASLPADSDPDYYKILAQIAGYDDSGDEVVFSVNQAVSHSLGFFLCNGSAQWWGV